MKMKKQSGAAVIAVIFSVALILIAGTGWVLNIVSIVKSDFAPITGMLVMRIIGVFMAPLGAVLGYF
jgi:hypothetical protein